MKIEISIIVPIYNAEKTLSQTLNSIRNQSYNNFEVLLIDDGSSDGSSKICNRYVSLDNRFNYVYQHNKGLSSARNEGLKIANGDYVIFVDSDDTLPPRSLEHLINAKNKFESALICGSYLMNKTRNRQLLMANNFDIIRKNTPQKFIDVLNRVPTAPWAKLYSREIIIKNNLKFPITIPYGEDAIFMYQYAEFVDEIVTIDDLVYEYNFLDCNSAGRKFYKNYCDYMREQFNEKEKLYQKFRVDSSSEELYFFRRCIDHYIINETNTKDCIEDILHCIAVFPNASKDSDYGLFVQEHNAVCLIKKWKCINRKYYYMEKLKKRYVAIMKNMNLE